MAREFEIIGIGAIGALLKRKAKHAPEPGTLCANCKAVLAGPYCHVCGQDADDHQRSIGHLAWEGVEGLTHLDGRLAQTLPLLFFRPGKLARDQLEGRRARHVPPFRLFLVSLLIFMFVLEGAFRTMTVHSTAVPGHPNVIVLAAGSDQKTSKAADTVAQDPDVAAAIKGISASPLQTNIGPWMETRLGRAMANKAYYQMVLFTWAHRLAILLLPILAALLALVYVRRKKLYLYDHLIVAMQFLSFEFLIFALAWLPPDPVRGWAMDIAVLWTPVNLFMTLRGAYGSGIFAAAIKTMFLWISTLTLFGLLVAGLMVLALAEM